MTPADIRRRLIARQEIALLDLREEDIFAQAHPLFAASLPLSRLELEILDRVPRKATPVVLYDDGDELALRGKRILDGLGYDAVSVLEGGIEAWRAAGGELFRDVNVPSKAFGELVESEDHTPSLPAEEVKKLIASNADLVVLDARRFDEYHTMSIPRGISVPGAELVLRAASLAPDPETTIIVNCAGRTRSLIGAQSLRNAGLPNPIYALRNGTIGWTLAGFTLETGQERRFPEVDEARLARARAAARKVAYRAGVRHLAYADLFPLLDEEQRTSYCFDVRTPEEFAQRHLPGFRSAPGGQLVQETDVSAPVRGARIVLFDDLGPRADMSASWLAQMGWDVLVLEDVPSDALIARGPWRPSLPPMPEVETITPATLQTLIEEDGATLLDLGPGPAYRRGHIAGAHFVIRARLAQDLPADLPRAKPVVLISPDDRLARFAAPDLQALGFDPLILEGGLASWSPRPLESGEGVPFSAFDDVYRRPYEGTGNPREAMQAYLDWEFGLVEQLRRDATHGFFVLAAPSAPEADEAPKPEPVVTLDWEELQEAFLFVNAAPAGENSARINLATGQIRHHSTWTDMWDKSDGYGAEDEVEGESLEIPHKTQLGLGRELALWFAEDVIPSRSEEVEDFFQKRGAYGKFKALLAEENLLQDWYQFENDAEEQGLRNWCEENGIAIAEIAAS